MIVIIIKEIVTNEDFEMQLKKDILFILGLDLIWVFTKKKQGSLLPTLLVVPLP